MRVACRIFAISLAVGSPMAIARDGGSAPVIQRSTLSGDGAMLALQAACREAQARGAQVSIAVVDVDGNLLAFQRIGAAFPATIQNAIAKASTSAQMGVPSLVLQELVDRAHPSYLAIAGLVPLQGGVPIKVAGKSVGGVGSSGAAADVDEAIAATGAAAIGGD